MRSFNEYSQYKRPTSELLLSGNRQWQQEYQQNLKEMDPSDLDQDFKTELAYLNDWFSHLSKAEQDSMMWRLLRDLPPEYKRLSMFVLHSKMASVSAKADERSTRVMFSKFYEAETCPALPAIPYGMDPRPSDHKVSGEPFLSVEHTPSATHSTSLPPIGAGSRPSSVIESSGIGLPTLVGGWGAADERPKSTDYSLFSDALRWIEREKAIAGTTPGMVPEVNEPQPSTSLSRLLHNHTDPRLEKTPLPPVAEQPSANVGPQAPSRSSPRQQQPSQSTTHTSRPSLQASSGKEPEDIDMDLVRDVPRWFRSLRLHKYNTNFESMQWYDIIQLNDEQLQEKGVATVGARCKMLKVFASVLAYCQSHPELCPK